MTTRPNEKQCVEMWEKSTSPAEYEAMYDKFMEDQTTEKGITQSSRVAREIQWERENAPVQLRLPLSKEPSVRYIDTQKLFCMRCGAWDAVQCRPDERMCGLNCALLTPGKICGYNCKLQRYQANLRARGLL